LTKVEVFCTARSRCLAEERMQAMYKHILIATDGSELAGKAVTTGVLLAKQLGAQVTVVTVTEPWRGLATAEPAFAFPIEEFEKEAAEYAARILADASEVARKQNVRCATLNPRGFAAEAIIETANARGCDLIVMSSHGRRGLARVLLGSQAMRVVTLSGVPVLICR
jgi:nucleotide-binding universal stress UspA family protein